MVWGEICQRNLSWWLVLAKQVTILFSACKNCPWEFYFYKDIETSLWYFPTPDIANLFNLLFGFPTNLLLPVNLDKIHQFIIFLVFLTCLFDCGWKLFVIRIWVLIILRGAKPILKILAMIWCFEAFSDNDFFSYIVT